MNLLLFQKKRLSKGIRLALDFMGGNLDSRISFSRGSNATVVGSNGLIQYAPHNLLTYSEQFDNAAWFKDGITVTANTTVSLDGAQDADTIVESDSTAVHYIAAANASLTSGVAYTLSVYAKAKERTFIQVCGSFSTFGSNVWGNFNLVDGTVGFVGSSAIATITNAGNGWYRCSITASATTTASGAIAVSLLNANTNSRLPSYTGDGVSGVYIWGAQLNQGALQPYYSTTVKNLLGYSQNFENAAWTKSNSGIASSTVIGPFGFDGGEKLVENTVNAAHGVNIDVTASPTTKYTVSSYIKAGERTWARIALIDNLGIDGGRAWFDLVNGVVGNVDVQGAGSNITASIVAVGNGWYRCSVSGQMNNSKTTLTSQIRLARSNGDISYIGDGVSGIYIFGAQLSDSASLDPYSYNPVAAPTSTAYYGPRFDYDPATLAPKGLLIEEQRTNLLIRSIPDLAIPTGWSVGIGGGTFTHTLVTAPSQFLGFQSFILQDQVTSGRGYLTTSITLSASTTYTLTCYFDTTNTYVTSGSTTIVFIGGLTDATGTLSASVSSIDSTGKVSITFTTGTAISAAIRVGIGASGTAVGRASYSAWQLEAGAFPTSYIPTTSATVTRAADNASMVGSNFSSWYNQSEGTVLTSFIQPIVAAGNYPSVMAFRPIGDIGSQTTIEVFASSSSANGLVRISGVDQASYIINTAAKTPVKFGLTYKTNSFGFSQNGSIGTDSLGDVPQSMDKMRIGQNTSTSCLNGHIQSIKYYPTRLPNADLQRLTR